MNLLTMAMMAATGSQIADVNMSVTSVSKTTPSGICFANMRISSDGNIYENSSATTDVYDSNVGTWLVDGSASEVWVSYTGLTGTLNHDPGAGVRVQLSGDYDIGVIDTTPGGSEVATFNLNFWDSAIGGLALATHAITLTATR